MSYYLNVHFQGQRVKFLDSFRENSNTKFHENPFIVSRVVPYKRTAIRTDTHMKNLTVAYTNFAKVRNKTTSICY